MKILAAMVDNALSLCFIIDNWYGSSIADKNIGCTKSQNVKYASSNILTG